MSYLVTARKWRPQTFESVVGQEHVTRTLQNALRQNRLAHSYLFSGPRGVGKTTLARILVKALNCEKGPTPTPCNTCSYCVEINEGRSLDYQEIDGASNRGIDQIRELNQSLGYLSPNQRHRVFVIDEVHMLTTEAFNALLKSLEEPPPKVVFVFCTTEAHKVPLTIRSRCQHHHFRAFSIPAITDQLRSILSAEKIAFEEESLFPIARAANGSMRDSQSLLDQVIAYAGEKITSVAVREVLGIIGSDNHFHFMEYLLAGDLAKNQALLLNLAHEGRDLKQFVLDLIHFLTALVFIQKGVASPHDLEVSPEDLATLKTFEARFTPEELFLLNDILFDLLREIKKSSEEKVLFDFFLVKLHRYKNLITPESLKSELVKLALSPEAMAPKPGIPPKAPTPALTKTAAAPEPGPVSDLDSAVKAAIEIFEGSVVENVKPGK